MNLRDLERRRKQLQEEEDTARHRHLDIDTVRMMESLDRLIDIFSQKSKNTHANDTKNAFNKIYGFEKQKQELIRFISAQNYLSSQTAKSDFSSKIICLVGPPGIGKTAFAQAISKILGKNFYLIPLAGRVEPMLLTGDLPTFKSANYGQIIGAILHTKSTDPVILLDEVDKSSEKSTRAGGEVAGIRKVLLQILDPLQNKEFKDQYLDAKIDLSQITFVLTANNVDELDPALKSRLEIIQLEGYSSQDKKHIAELILNELFLQTNYLNYGQLEITDSAWEKLISLTHEEGVRQLKQGISKILIYCYDKWAEDYNENRSPQKILIDPTKIEEIIPKEFFVIDDSKQEQKRLKEREELIKLEKLDKQWRSNQQKFQSKLLIILAIGIFLLLANFVLLAVIILKKQKLKQKLK